MAEELFRALSNLINAGALTFGAGMIGLVLCYPARLVGRRATAGPAVVVAGAVMCRTGGETWPGQDNGPCVQYPARLPEPSIPRSARRLEYKFRVAGIQSFDPPAEHPTGFAQEAAHRHVRPIGRCPYLRMLQRGGVEQFPAESASTCTPVYDEKRDEDLSEEIAVIKATKPNGAPLIFDQSETAAIRHRRNVGGSCLRARRTCVDPDRSGYLVFCLSSSNLHAATVAG